MELLRNQTQIMKKEKLFILIAKHFSFGKSKENQSQSNIVQLALMIGKQILLIYIEILELYFMNLKTSLNLSNATETLILMKTF